MFVSRNKRHNTLDRINNTCICAVTANIIISGELYGFGAT